MSKRNEQTTNATVHDALHRIFDREYVESHIRPILRPSGDNGDCICYEKVGDMSLYLYVEMGNDGYAKITQPILDMCGMSANEAYASAFKNICPAIYRMEDVITGYFGRMGGQRMGAPHPRAPRHHHGIPGHPAKMPDAGGKIQYAADAARLRNGR